MKLKIPVATFWSHQAGIGHANNRAYKKADLAAYQQWITMKARSELRGKKFERIGREPYQFSLKMYIRKGKRPDVVNIVKAIEDALEGLLYENDFWCIKMNLEIILSDENYFEVEVKRYKQKTTHQT